MKRFVCFIAVLLLPLAAAAQVSDAVLTPDGTLYTVRVERAYDHPEIVTASSSYLVLLARNGEEATREIVPATLAAGSHTDPALAYDAESGMLLLLWLRHSGLMYNELVLAVRNAAGEWGEPTTIGAAWDYRENLRIAVTRKVHDRDTGEVTPGVSVHASWWELNTSTGDQSARYAMLTIEQGLVAAIHELDLSQFVDPAKAPIAGDENVSALKQSLLHSSPTRDSVLITFGHLDTRTMQQVRVRPTKIGSDVRIRIPIGRSEGATAAPRFSASANARVEGIYGDSGALALYVRGEKDVSYIILRNGEWSVEKSIVLDGKITSELAVAAVRRLVDEQ